MFFEKSRPYIVAEMNSSHRGKIDAAKKMIDAAKKCGCDAVKFQSWTDKSLYCKTYYDKNRLARRMVKGFEMKPENLKELAEYCDNVGIDFSSTLYSNDEADFLVRECNAPYIKIASMDINNIPFLRYIASLERPVVLSTGMASFEEIKSAVTELETHGCDELCILHCVSVYPVDAKDVNLNNMVMLKQAFPECQVGYSDHTIGSAVSCAATALGAVMIEKHFTLDSSVIGWDNQMATEPDDMKKMVTQCRTVAASLGSFERHVSKEELLQRKKMRRSIIANRDLTQGQIINENDIAAKRPGDGISVSMFYDIIGKKLKRNIEADEMILPEDLE